MSYRSQGILEATGDPRAPLHENLLGNSPAIREVNALISKLANTNLTVLITGETGTGKDIAAHLLHKWSSRYGKAFIKVNCPAIPEGILESELFGYERGAFTGARNSKPGRFELANHGTILLDEITETPPAVQGRLLQVLDGEPFMRVGGVAPIHTDARVLAATNVPIDVAMRLGQLRKDVCFRLSEVVIHLLPLRERPEDIPLLAEHFLFNYSDTLAREYKPLPPDAVARLREEDWPGNVRELAARIKKYVVSGNLEALFERDLEFFSHFNSATVTAGAKTPSWPRTEVLEKKPVSLKEATRRAVEATERTLIEETLRRTLWNRRKAAKLLGISYSSLLRRIDTYRIGKPHTG